MGWLTAYLPATDAAAVWGVVDDMAHQLRHTTGEDRTLSQLRADSLTGIITGRLLPADRFTDAGAGAATSLADARLAPSLANYGVLPAAATDVTESARSRPVRSPAADRRRTARTYRCARVAAGHPSARAGSGAAGTGHPDPPRRPRHQSQPPPCSAWTTHPDTSRDTAPSPPRPHGIIATDATWQRLLTDPVTGILTDYSTTTYQPGKVLRAAVEARDETCTFGWCDTPASRSDLDHIQPFDHQHHEPRRHGHGERSWTDPRPEPATPVPQAPPPQDPRRLGHHPRPRHRDHHLDHPHRTHPHPTTHRPGHPHRPRHHRPRHQPRPHPPSPHRPAPTPRLPDHRTRSHTHRPRRPAHRERRLHSPAQQRKRAHRPRRTTLLSGRRWSGVASSRWTSSSSRVSGWTLRRGTTSCPRWRRRGTPRTR